MRVQNRSRSVGDQEAHVGPGSLERLEAALARFPSERVFLVTGKGSYAASGAEGRLAPVLARRSVERFADFSTNPDLRDVIRGVDAFVRFMPDVVIAVGGGSVLDLAKAVNALAFHPEPLRDYVEGRRPLRTCGVPLIAIPTTAGSGSEATHFAVVYVETAKRSLADPLMRPDVALVDPALTHSASPALTAATGADALCQAIESLWSVEATRASQADACEAITCLWGELETVVRRPTVASRAQVSRAAYLAGRAIDVSKTTACHAFSYPFTALFGVPHGHAVSFTLAQVLRFNAGVTRETVQDARGLGYVQDTMGRLVELLGAPSPDVAAAAIERLLLDIGLTRSASTFGATPDDLERLLAGASPERMRNNPRRITEAAARGLLGTLF